MIRRHMLASDLRYSHITTPRKQRTYAHANIYNPTILYRSNNGNYPTSTWQDTPTKKWIGKVFIPIGATPHEIHNTLLEAGTRDFVLESEVAQTARPNYFKIYRMYGSYVKSIPSVKYRSPQMNIFLDEKDIIRAIRYF